MNKTEGNALDIYDYFELYLKNRIKYDRNQHIKNMSSCNFKAIDKKLIQQIFTYIDQVLFGGKLTAFVKDNKIEFQFKVPKSMTSTAGFFYWKDKGKDMQGRSKGMIMGFKISHVFFQNIVDKNILNMDLGVLDEKNKKTLSTNTIEPLLTTMEHEIIHMLMFVTRSHKLNDLSTVKSGHTRVFKQLVRNIFGHYTVTHGFARGDMVVSLGIKNSLSIGSYVRGTAPKSKGLAQGQQSFEGYVVLMKEKSLVVCQILKPKNKYFGAFYKDVEIIENTTDHNIDVEDLMYRLQPEVKIQLDGVVMTIQSVGKTMIRGLGTDQRIWQVPKFRILDIVFL